jgi:hypothetical protein
MPWLTQLKNRNPSQPVMRQAALFPPKRSVVRM